MFDLIASVSNRTCCYINDTVSTRSAPSGSIALLEKVAKVPNLVVGGRLDQYKYFDMDKSILAALEVAI